MPLTSVQAVHREIGVRAVASTTALVALRRIRQSVRQSLHAVMAACAGSGFRTHGAERTGRIRNGRMRCTQRDLLGVVHVALTAIAAIARVAEVLGHETPDCVGTIESRARVDLVDHHAHVDAAARCRAGSLGRVMANHALFRGVPRTAVERECTVAGVALRDRDNLAPRFHL